jgi:very-short-patch-repair endonuclease
MPVKEKPAQDRIAEIRSQFVDEYLRQKGEEFDCYLQDAASDSASPIEQLMAMGLVFAISCEGWHGGIKYENNFCYGLPSQKFEELGAFIPACPGIEVLPEIPVGNYRTDFLVRYAHVDGGFVFGAIECDGHDYHDLTKEQASHDRERDRYFQDAGLIILRYTGSEIWKNPLKCSVDALGILERRAKDNTAKRWR